MKNGNHFKSLKMPRFARNLLRGGAFNNLRCRHCSRSLLERDVEFAGVARAEDGTLCFSYEAICVDCKKPTRVLDRTHTFSDSDWWNQIRCWHEEALERLGPFDPNESMRGAIRLLVGPPPLAVMRVCYGYKGDVGPIILYCNGNLFANGYGSVRLEPKDRIRLLLAGDSENMPHERWRRRKVAEGDRFEYGGNAWTRMTSAELREIVRDRVFEVFAPLTGVAVTTKNRSTRKGHETLQPNTRRRKNRSSSRDSRQMDS
jgi:hypothetical protein